MPQKRKRAAKHIIRFVQTSGEVVHVGDSLDQDGTSNSSPQQLIWNRLEDNVRAGNEVAVRQTLAQQEVDLKTLEGGDLLWTAYALGKDDIAMMLVRYGVNLSVRKHVDNRTLLHHMLRGSRIGSTATRNLFCLMLDSGADIDARDNEGYSLLHDAIVSSQQGSIELAKELLKRGTQIMFNERNRLKDDIYLICKHKRELLPELIEHRELDKETRMAIEWLVSEKYTDNEEDALLMIKKIFGLGFPVNVLNRQSDKWKLAFLDIALQHEHLIVVELLLNLGADVNVTDKCGNTPFVSMEMKKKWQFTESHRLMIKFLALMIARGEKVSQRNKTKIDQHKWSRSYFEKCMIQIEQMKIEKVDGQVACFLLMSKNIYSKLQLVKNQEFLINFKRDKKEQNDLLPYYYAMLENSFEIAEKQLKVLMAEKQELDKVFRYTMPDNVSEKIAFYLCYEKLVLCHCDYIINKVQWKLGYRQTPKLAQL